MGVPPSSRKILVECSWIFNYKPSIFGYPLFLDPIIQIIHPPVITIVIGANSPFPNGWFMLVLTTLTTLTRLTHDPIRFFWGQRLLQPRTSRCSGAHRGRVVGSGAPAPDPIDSGGLAPRFLANGLVGGKIDRIFPWNMKKMGILERFPMGHHQEIGVGACLKLACHTQRRVRECGMSEGRNEVLNMTCLVIVRQSWGYGIRTLGTTESRIVYVSWNNA